MADLSGLLDFEKELTCSICTEILYQPLTLLDCLHTYCGGCLKEWFAHQAASRAQYSCPSCREPVRGTKADWRLTAHLEGFLKAHPDKGKTEAEKEDLRAVYKPGDDVLPPLPARRRGRHESDSEDERLLAEVREMSMTNIDPETARRRAERAERDRQRRRRNSPGRNRTDEAGRSQQSRRMTEQRGEAQRGVEHQPSLRSLLSGSDIQEEILQSIYSEGLLEGIDIDHLTPAQEEELTERIAEAYRRRQRNRDRSRNRERERENGEVSTGRMESPSRRSARPETTSTSLQAQSPQPQPRPRPPISRPHLFEQASSDSTRTTRHHRRSASGSSQRNPQQADTRSTATRSVTDLSLNPSSSTDEQRRQRQRGSSRSSTNPEDLRESVRNIRGTNTTLHAESGRTGSSRARSHEPPSRPREAVRTHTQPVANGPESSTPSSTPDVPSAIAVINQNIENNNDFPVQSIRPAPSLSAFAPEPISTDPILSASEAIIPVTAPQTSPVVSCSRCNRSGIQEQLHYNCSKCSDGQFNLCLDCYRAGRGCKHWYGFGFMAMEKWSRNAPADGHAYEMPHVLTARKYLPSSAVTIDDRTRPDHHERQKSSLQDGAFCESCFSHADNCYWYCELCLSGAWGFCNTCVLKGNHCTHPLLPVARLPTSQMHKYAKVQSLPIPHLPKEQYILSPPHIDCDICALPIPSASPRFHCTDCSGGDYDICTPCYRALCQNGKISERDGEQGWRRCPQRHRMSVVAHDSSARRITIREKVGGWRLRDDRSSAAPPDLPSAAGPGNKFVAIYSYFPPVEDESRKDELVFPRNAEITESEELNEDWSVGVYAGRVGVWPRGYARRM